MSTDTAEHFEQPDDHPLSVQRPAGYVETFDHTQPHPDSRIVSQEEIDAADGTTPDAGEGRADSGTEDATDDGSATEAAEPTAEASSSGE